MNRRYLSVGASPTRSMPLWAYCVVGCACGLGVIFVGCSSSTQRRVTPTLEAPPRLSAEELAQQGETVSKPMALDPLSFGVRPATLAVLTNETAADMGWKEHFILQEEREGSYTVVISEGTTLGIQRRVSITPTARGSEMLILPPDEGLAVRVKERVLAYLTGSNTQDQPVSPLVQRFSHPFSRVWRATKQTIIDGGFSFKTADEEVGFIETERVSLGKASRSWFQGVGKLTRVARPPALSYDFKSIEWRYRIRVTPVGESNTEINIEAVVEAIPDASTLSQLTGGTLDLLSVPFGSWISSAATGSDSSRLLLPSRGELEKEFYAALVKKIPSVKKKRAQSS
ncbi:MAG: hypothetical protein AB7P69_13850 [Candidatus Binatia bacterium]